MTNPTTPRRAAASGASKTTRSVWVSVLFSLLAAAVIIVVRFRGDAAAEDELRTRLEGIEGVQSASVEAATRRRHLDPINATVHMDTVTPENLAEVVAAWEDAGDMGYDDPASGLLISWRTAEVDDLSSSLMSITGWDGIPSAAAVERAADLWRTEGLSGFQLHFLEGTYWMTAMMEVDASEDWYSGFLAVLDAGAALEESMGYPGLAPSNGVWLEEDGETLAGIPPGVAGEIRDPGWADVLMQMMEFDRLDPGPLGCTLAPGPVVDCTTYPVESTPEADEAFDHLRTLVEDLGGTIMGRGDEI